MLKAYSPNARSTFALNGLNVKIRQLAMTKVYVVQESHEINSQYLISRVSREDKSDFKKAPQHDKSLIYTKAVGNQLKNG